MTHSAIKETNELISISEYANSEANIKDLLIKASKSELLLYVALRPHSSTLVAIPSHENPRQGSNQNKGVIYAPLLPHYAELIAEFGEAVIEQYEASVEGKAPLDWHYWMLDAPQKVTINEVKIDKTLTYQTSSDPTGKKWTSGKLEELNQFYLNEKNVKKTKAFLQATASHYGVTPRRIEQLLKIYKKNKPTAIEFSVQQLMGISYHKK